ncbi:MAG: sigma-70 family RNA polymerase sigma factor, partial [Chitinophagaceae bacterium]|nr:sigma-70 family RNA polymerase sigma factor [Chitinophagaceae bacterium]
SIVIQVTRNRQTTEDIMQETFLRLWEKKMILKNDNIGGWLYRVALNLSYKHLRKESCKNRLYTSLQTDHPVCNDVEEQLLQKEHRNSFARLYDRLPEQQQAVYLLSSQAGLSRSEIAAHLNISPNTVKNHLSRAVRFIRANVKYACIFLLFTTINYIFFVAGSTRSAPVDLFKVQDGYHKTSSKYSPVHTSSSTTEFTSKLIAKSI